MSSPNRAISFVTRSFSTSCSVFRALIGSSAAVTSTSRSVSKTARIRFCVGAATAFGSPSICAGESLVAPLVADGAAGEPVLGGQLAEQPRDLGRRQRAVEANGRERADVPGPVRGCLVGLVLRDQERRRALPGDEHDPEAADLHPPPGGQHHVLRQAQEDGVQLELGHRLLHLLDSRHTLASSTGARSSAAFTPATTSSTCGSTARSSGAA